MKKYLFLFIFFSTAAILYLSFPANSSEHFVSIKARKFELNGKDFYPIAVNYLVSLQADKKGVWARPYFGYTPDGTPRTLIKDSALAELTADMELIKEMGFNSVRLVGAAGEEDVNRKTGELAIVASLDNTRDTTVTLLSDESYKKYFIALHELFDAAGKAGLKIIFLVRMVPSIYSTENHLRRLATEFKNDTNIMAYDFFNEPLYFDSLTRNKIDVYPITKRWNKVLKMYAPNHLSTIGLEGIREIFEWDPDLLDVDFVSLHPYEFEKEQVRNELYWYGHYIKKPWILGETAIAADNIQVSYEDQKRFAHKTLKQAYNCGASGYSWWQYKDVEWFDYHANYMGAVSRTGETRTKKGNMIVKGTVKPVTEEFIKFNLTDQKDSCLCLSNYYNYSEHKNFRITGYVRDENNKPIPGAVVLAWNQYWSHSYHTISKADGSFELMSDFPFYHWIASTSLYSMVRADISPDTAKTYKDNIPTINVGDIKLHQLSPE